MPEFLNNLSWAHTIPAMAVVLALIFRKAIGRKISEISYLRREGKTYNIGFSLPQKAAPSPGETVITQDDVLEAFKKIPELTEKEIKKELKQAHGWLLRNGVVTRPQLQALVSSEVVLETLRKLYVEELLRSKEAPLDPVAVSTWGATLFTFGLTRQAVAAVRSRLRQGAEYKEKHA